jgi:serine/threonine protein kinase
MLMSVDSRLNPANSNAPRTSPKPGDTVGRFTLEQRLGEGGVGVVHRASDPSSGEIVALKLLKSELCVDPGFVHRFEREARIARSVQHRHLVPVVDAGADGGVHYLAARFYGGGSLDDRLRGEGPLAPDRILRLAAGLGEALDTLHQMGIVHRDVKPANVMLEESGDAALTDFGLAKGAASTRLTQVGHVLGSIEYMAPELIGGGEATPASDVYAFGCLLHACIAGQPPFVRSTFLQTGFAHLEDDPPDPTAGRPDVPPAFGSAIRLALDKEPEKRPATATTVARLLAAGARMGAFR